MHIQVIHSRRINKESKFHTPLCGVCVCVWTCVSVCIRNCIVRKWLEKIYIKHKITVFQRAHTHKHNEKKYNFFSFIISLKFSFTMFIVYKQKKKLWNNNNKTWIDVEKHFTVLQLICCIAISFFCFVCNHVV